MSTWFVALGVAVGVGLIVVACVLAWRRSMEGVGASMFGRIRDGVDRDHDDAKRDRIVVLEKRWETVARAMSVGMAVFGACMVLALVGVVIIYGRLQDSRLQAFHDACEATNVEHDRIVQFIVAAGGREGPARVAFPTTRDCWALAHERLSKS